MEIRIFHLLTFGMVRCVYSECVGYDVKCDDCSVASLLKFESEHNI